MLTLLAAAFVLSNPFGEIFGDLRLGESYLADVKIALMCGEQTVESTTDKSGSFRLSTRGSGPCSVTVTYKGKPVSVKVVVFDQPARYRLLLEEKEGTYILKRV